MNPPRNTVLGIYNTRNQAEWAVEVLKVNGFSLSDISALFTENAQSKDFAEAEGTHAPESATRGAGVGAAIGGTLGLLLGAAVLAVPGAGILLAAGPIEGALAVGSFTGAVGTISGAFVGFGVSDSDAEKYEGYIKSGRILLSIHTNNAEATASAKRCLERTGADNILEISEELPDWKAFSHQRDQHADKVSTVTIF